MLGSGALEYRERQDAAAASDGRPSKRARNAPGRMGDGTGYPPESAPVGISEDVPSPSDSAKSTRPERTPTQRAPDKDRNRRLSCKECRRWVGFPISAGYWGRLLECCCFGRLKLKASRLLRWVLWDGVLNGWGCAVQCDRIFPCQVGCPGLGRETVSGANMYC